MGKMPGRPPGESSGGGGRSAAGRAARRVAEGQHDSSGGAPDEAVPRVAPPEEIAGYVTVRICGETAAGEKERANEWCEVFSKYRKAGGAAVGRGMNPPEEIAGYVTVRICGETAAAEKRANEWCEDFSKYRRAGGAAVGRGMSPLAGEKRRCHVHLPAGAPA